MKYRFIEKNRSAFPVKKMCQALEVTPSGFYCWGEIPYFQAKTTKKIRIKQRVEEIFSVHKGMVTARLLPLTCEINLRFLALVGLALRD
jgi:hypothetical protein